MMAFAGLIWLGAFSGLLLDGFLPMVGGLVFYLALIVLYLQL
jgi:hypothetical protein